LSLPAGAILVPNGDFETPGGDQWEEVNATGTYGYDYPATDGNPDGYGIIDNSSGGGGFGIWVANAGAAITLDSLGLSAGETYRFSQDMKILSGSNIGGFKVDFFTGADGAGSTGDLYPSVIGDGSNWATYNFAVTIPAAADGIKVVPLWGPDSSIAYDNISVDPSPIEPQLIPNGDFENGRASWFELGGDTTWEYPGSGGNPDGYGVMDHGGEVGTFAIWVANGGAPLALDALGLAAGAEVTFLQDMILLSGDRIGGLKIEFLAGATFLSDTGDMYPTLINEGDNWSTYAFDVVIPPTTDHIKVVPLWGPGSRVGYDNVRFTAMAAPRSFADIELGTVVTWQPEAPERIYQAQESFDLIEWDNIGEPVLGVEINTTFTTNPAPFYRVEEFEVVAESAVFNGDFETESFSDPTCAESWICFTTTDQAPTRITSDSRSGDASMRIAVVNDASAMPNTSEIQQDVSNVGGFVIPSETYQFSFWAKQISSGVSYVQNYRVQWLDAGGAILEGGVGFNSFTGGDDEWIEIKASDLVAPANAATAYIQIFGATGAVAGDTARGEVLIDDLMLSTTTIRPYGTDDAVAAEGVRISWDTEEGKSYQVESSDTDLDGFANFGPAILGDGQSASLSDLVSPGAKFYQVKETAAP
jgi:hypothetical protein